MKLVTELGESGEFWNHLGLSCGLMWGVGSSGAIQIHMLNKAMKYYEQMEAIPIYQTSVSIMWILTGLIVFDEIRFYSEMQLLGIAGSVVLSCVGIKFLTMKTRMLKELPKEEDSEKLTTELSTKETERGVIADKTIAAAQ